jgi:hypothetical protein
MPILNPNQFSSFSQAPYSVPREIETFERILIKALMP